MPSSTIGTDESGNKITVDKKDRREGFYILGATGKGKSTMINTMLIDDIKNGDGVCLIDPNTDLIDSILSQLAYHIQRLNNPKLNKRDRKICENIKKRVEEDLIIIDLGSREYVAPFSLFFCENPDDPFDSENVVSAFMHVLSSNFDISELNPRMYQYFINIARLLTYNPDRTILDIKRLMTNDVFLEKLLLSVRDRDRDSDVLWFWQEFFQKYSKGTRRGDDISMISNKLEDFTKPVMRPWFGDTRQSINFRYLMDNQKIVFIKLKSQWPSLTKLLGNIIIAQLLDAGYSRSDIPRDKRKQMNIYVDEVQDFASPDFARLFTQSRKYGLSLTMAHQVLEQLDPLVKATCKQALNIAVFKVSSDNSKELAGEFDCSPLPGPPRLEPIRTPVRNPIHFMALETRGVHPGEATRNFMEKYGKLLVKNAKKEEDIERDSRREQQRIEYDLTVPFKRVGSPVITVEHHATIALESLNTLFYQAMLAGKTGENPDDISIPPGLCDLLIRAINGAGSHYLRLVEEYQNRMRSIGVEVVAMEERRKELEAHLTDLPLLIEEKASSLHAREIDAKEKLREVYRKYILAQVLPVRANIFIVEKPIKNPQKLFALRNIDIQFAIPYWYWQGRMLYVEAYEGMSKNIPHNFESVNHTLLHAIFPGHVYPSWEEAAWFYLQLYEKAWFHIDQRAFLNKRNWKRSEQYVLLCEDIVAWGKSEGWGDPYGAIGWKKAQQLARVLPVWELLPGIENTWVTPSLVEHELARYMQDIENAGYAYSKVRNLATELLQDDERRHSRDLPDTSIIKIRERAEHALSTAKSDTSKTLEGITKATEKKRGLIEDELNLIAQIEFYKKGYEQFTAVFETEIRQIMRELASSPVEADSGLTREVPGPEIPSTEVEARIANQLKLLPQYTARVRLSTGEYTINTIDPSDPGDEEEDEENTEDKKKHRKPPYVSYRELHQFIEEIQQRNVAQGYLRLRTVVEKEILARRQWPNDSPPPARPVPAQPKPLIQSPAGAAASVDTSDTETEPSLPAVKVQKPNTPLPTPRSRRIKKGNDK